MTDEVLGTPEAEPLADTQTTGTEAEASDDTLSYLDDDQPADEVIPEDDPPEPRKLKVKIDGQELEVDEEEAARGYQRQADYSRNMQKLQAEMQQAEAVRVRYQQQLEQFIPESVARINALQQAAEQYRQTGDVENLALVQYDLNAEIMRYQQANAEQTRLSDEQKAQAQQQRQQNYQMVEQAVLETIPEWKNPDTRKAEVVEVSKILGDFVGKHYGQNAAQIMSDINDGAYGPMPIVLARKAMLYDKLMAKVAARKASKSEETSAPAPAQSVRTTGGVSKDPSQMNDKEFAAWRKKQIANR